MPIEDWEFKPITLGSNDGYIGEAKIRDNNVLIEFKTDDGNSVTSWYHDNDMGKEKFKRHMASLGLDVNVYKVEGCLKELNKWHPKVTFVISKGEKEGVYFIKEIRGCIWPSGETEVIEEEDEENENEDEDVTTSEDVVNEKRDRFLRIYPSRLKNVQEAIRRLANCGNRHKYTYTENEVLLIVEDIEEAFKKLKTAFHVE